MIGARTFALRAALVVGGLLLIASGPAAWADDDIDEPDPGATDEAEKPKATSTKAEKPKATSTDAEDTSTGNDELSALEEIAARALADLLTAPPEKLLMLAAVTLKPKFPTGEWTLYKGFGECDPPTGCSILQARKPPDEMVPLDQAWKLAKLFPPTNAQEAANITGFLLRQSDAFTDFDCAKAPHDGANYVVKDVTPAIPKQATNVKTDGKSLIIIITEACRGTPDRLLRSEHRYDPDGTWTRTETKVLAEGTILP